MNKAKTISQLVNALKQGYTVSNGEIVSPKVGFAAQNPQRTERHFCIAIAGHVIEINSLYAEAERLCTNYVCDAVPELQIKIDESDINWEREEANVDNSPNGEDYLETLAIYRKIAEAMLSYDTFLMHGAVIAYGNSAYMFTAESGTGKTTHIQKWLKGLEDTYAVNGDKPLIKITDTEAIACGTPWCGKEQMNTNTMVPLKAIVMMERGEDNYIIEISFKEAFSFLLKQTYRPNGTEMMRKTLQLLSLLNGRLRFYRFIFNNMKEDAFDVSFQALTGEEL